MCLAMPVKIESKIAKAKYQIEDGRIVDTSLVPDAQVGDWLLCHADLAVNKINEKEARNIFKLVKKCSHNRDINVSYNSSSSS